MKNTKVKFFCERNTQDIERHFNEWSAGKDIVSVELTTREFNTVIELVLIVLYTENSEEKVNGRYKKTDKK